MTETFAEKQARTRRESAQRMRILFTVAVLTVVARMLIKDPVRPPPADHSGVEIKIMPGMLESLPASERAKLNPVLIARMMAVDEEARLNKGRLQHEAEKEKAQTALAYAPEKRPEAEDVMGEKEKQHRYQVARRQKATEVVQAQFKQAQEAPMKTLVRFTTGGALRVEEARRSGEGLTVRLAGVAVTYPSRMIGSISTNPADFQDPVPAGKVKLQPAHGITIILDRESAQRITVSKSSYDEI